MSHHDSCTLGIRRFDALKGAGRLGIKRWVLSKNEAKATDELYKVRTGEDPSVKIGGRDQTRCIDMAMGSFDDHVTGGGNKDTGWFFRVSFQKPEGNRDVVHYLEVVHGDGAIDLEEVGSLAIVVCEGLCLDLQAGKLF